MNIACCILFGVLAVAALVSASHDAAEDMGEVVLVHVLHRHGDRSPQHTYPNDPYNANWSTYWPAGFSQMTKVGYEHSYELGRFLRTRYGNILPEKYNRSTIKVRSTYTDTTLTTSECLLSALYPPLKTATGNVRWQPIPVFTTPTEDDTLLEVPSCKQLEAVEAAVANTTEMKCVAKKISDIGKLLLTVAGTTDWNHVYDTFLSEESQNMSLPKWSSSVYPEPLASIWAWTKWEPTRLQQKFTSGNLVDEITEHMEEKIMGHLAADPKMFLYSAHHTTIVDLLSALQAYNFRPVPFAAAVMVELRRRSASNYVVAVWYRNSTTHEPYLLKMDGCDSLCPFDTFVSLTSELVPSDYAKECSQSLPTGYKVELQKPGKNSLWDECITN